MEMNSMLRTQIQLTEQQAMALKTKAAAEGVSMAELIRRCINHALSSQVTVEPRDRMQRAISAAGRFHCDKEDLAVNHDKYLAEAFDK